ncbi:uncharacterized protein F5Z01DRAFT_753450 [Emericellopsis atlantica]|uniref:C2H2-type domain-containing protein n=1 Tax=Emericellopsis atlantica TaxID=2614577 RepID=A0A9P7ZEE4_9HYPO|nr:uncharacterized protein F5Z01DRAFT_753450 [Emericellopsis atlantica]KAG9250613.1 hypothetical protein F5Z01DRAFT_753450 [Emericellopsis atlantica]
MHQPGTQFANIVKKYSPAQKASSNIPMQPTSGNVPAVPQATRQHQPWQNIKEDQTTATASSLHSTEFRCCDCDRQFNSSQSLEQHLQDATHSPKPEHKCKTCHRKFGTAIALKNHMRDKTHPKLKCDKCSHRLITRPHHDADGVLLEVNKRLETITQVQNTEVGTLSKKPPSCDSKISLTPSWTPNSESIASEDWAVLVSQSGTQRCPFCPSERLPFASELALQHHLQSAAHSQPFVFCPSPLGSKRMRSKHQSVRSFNTISGLVQHLESGKCSGGIATFWEAMSYLETRIEILGLDMKFIT